MSITPEELLLRMESIDLSLYKKSKPKVKSNNEIKEKFEQPKEFPIVKAICTKCDTIYEGRAISFTVNKEQYLIFCPNCIDKDLWWLHHGMRDIKIIKEENNAKLS